MAEPTPLFYDAVTRWVPWFAWRPVDTTDYGWVWMRRVHKRRIQKKFSLPGPPDLAWQYMKHVEKANDRAE